MTMKRDAKLEEELTCRFKTDMRTLMNFDPSTRISQNFALLWDLFDQSIDLKKFELKKYRGVIFDGIKDRCKI